jgi:hypothetical protein
MFSIFEGHYGCPAEETLGPWSPYVLCRSTGMRSGKCPGLFGLFFFRCSSSEEDPRLTRWWQSCCFLWDWFAIDSVFSFGAQRNSFKLLVRELANRIIDGYLTYRSVHDLRSRVREIGLVNSRETDILVGTSYYQYAMFVYKWL